MDGYCFGSMETPKEWGGEIPNFKALSVSRGKGEDAVLW
jgi:hypothetical protein